MISYRPHHGGCDGFADPRAAGRIDFVVCREGARTWRAGHYDLYMLDNWMGFDGKFAHRLASAVGKLTKTMRGAHH